MVLCEHTLADEITVVMVKSLLASPGKELANLLRTVFSQYYVSCPEEMKVRLLFKPFCGETGRAESGAGGVS